MATAPKRATKTAVTTKTTKRRCLGVTPSLALVILPRAARVPAKATALRDLPFAGFTGSGCHGSAAEGRAIAVVLGRGLAAAGRATPVRVAPARAIGDGPRACRRASRGALAFTEAATGAPFFKAGEGFGSLFGRGSSLSESTSTNIGASGASASDAGAWSGGTTGSCGTAAASFEDWAGEGSRTTACAESAGPASAKTLSTGALSTGAVLTGAGSIVAGSTVAGSAMAGSTVAGSAMAGFAASASRKGPKMGAGSSLDVVAGGGSFEASAAGTGSNTATATAGALVLADAAWSTSTVGGVAALALALGASRPTTRTASLSRSTVSSLAKIDFDSRDCPKSGSPRKVPASGTATKHTGLNLWSRAKVSASSNVSLATTATCTPVAVSHQS